MSESFATHSISLDSANRVIAGALAKAAEMGLTVTVAVTDAQGTLKAYQRMEGASVLSTDVAVNKAFTAATSGFDTGSFFEFIKTDPALLHGMTNIPRFAIFGGGLQITESGRGVIGAIGVSGAHYSEDEQIAQAGIQAVFG